jgi:hypothetical protein
MKGGEEKGLWDEEKGHPIVIDHRQQTVLMVGYQKNTGTS